MRLSPGPTAHKGPSPAPRVQQGGIRTGSVGWDSSCVRPGPHGEVRVLVEVGAQQVATVQPPAS